MTKIYKAHKGRAFPVRVENRIVLITEDKETPIDEMRIDYHSRIALKRAIQDKDILEVTPNTKVKGTAK